MTAYTRPTCGEKSWLIDIPSKYVKMSQKMRAAAVRKLNVGSFCKAVLVLAFLIYLPGCATVYSGVPHSMFIEKQKNIHSVTVLPLDAAFEEKQGNGTEVSLYENMKTANRVSEDEIQSLFQAKGYELYFFKPSEQISEGEDFKKAAAFYNETLDKVFNSRTADAASVGWPVPAPVSQAASADAYLFVREVGYVKAQDAQMTEAITQGVISGAFALFTGYSSYTPLDPTSALMVRAVLFDSGGKVLWHGESPSLNDPRNEQNIRSRLKELFGGFPRCVSNPAVKDAGSPQAVKIE